MFRIAGLGILLAIFAVLLTSCMGGDKKSSNIFDPGSTVVDYALRGADSMVKILPTTNKETLETTTRVEATRGEHEAFQVTAHLSEGAAGLQNVTVQSSDLVMGDSILSKDNIKIYLEYYVKITMPTDASGDVGFWPDALVPISKPFSVIKDIPSTVWVDIYVPRETPAGIYEGTITFSSSNLGSRTYPYQLEVWDITMPEKLRMKANCGIDQEDVAWAHGLKQGTPEHYAMCRKYADMLADAYQGTHGIPVLYPSIYLNPDEKSYTLDFAKMDADIDRYYFGKYRLSSFFFPLTRFDLYPQGFVGHGENYFSPNFNARFVNYVQQVSNHLAAKGLIDISFVFLFDEPESAIHYQWIRDMSDLVHSCNPCPKFFLTEQPHPQDDSYGDLYNWVDIFCSNILVFHWGGPEELMRQGGENKEEWLYSNAGVYPLPSMAIDKPGIETRVQLWFVYQHKFKGFMYPSANDWSKANPWVDSKTFTIAMGNGCNSLFYPGPMINKYTGQDNVDAPISSMRFEQMRDGIEDTELMYMLADGEPIPEIAALIPGWTDFSRNSQDLLAARRNIAKKIIENRTQ